MDEELPEEVPPDRRLATALSGTPHFAVVAGLAPGIAELDAAVDTTTRDWLDLPSGSATAEAEGAAGRTSPDLADALELEASSLQLSGSLRGRAQEVAPPPKPPAFCAPFVAAAEGNLWGDHEDLLRLTRSPPITLWVLGSRCGRSGNYKAEVCRRLAGRLGLQWLCPRHLLELSVKTPPRHRSPLMHRCAEQLLRGLEVPVSDALRLALEVMGSARCKTNGYVLDFPPVAEADLEAVSSFIDQVRQVSAHPEVQKGEFLKDSVVLEPLAPEPEPPAPEPEPDDEAGSGGEERQEEEEEGQDGGGEGGEEEEEGQEVEKKDEEEPAAPEGAGEGGADTEGGGAPVEAAAGGEGVLAPEGEEGALPPDETQEAEEEGPQEPPEPPPPSEPHQPNPWANAMPRRVVLLSMELDEVANWRLALLKARHAERDRLRQEAEENGEELEEEEVEEPEPPPVLEDEEADEVFEAKAHDVFLTMEPYMAVPPLEAPPIPPPLPEESAKVRSEEVDEEAFANSEAAIVKALHGDHRVPLLSLHADGRPPEVMADLIKVVTGKLPSPVAPLPEPIEGAADVGEATELLQAGLNETQAGRRWSLWRQICPVSLYEKRLIPGEKEFAVDYAGFCFLFADVSLQRRFLTWPKLFLSEAPRINLTGMSLGFVLLSPDGVRSRTLAEQLNTTYGFDVIEPTALVEAAMLIPALDYVPPEPPAVEEGAPPEDGTEGAPPPPPPPPPPEEPPIPEGVPRLLVAEQDMVRAGKQLELSTILRLVGEALGVARNAEIVAEHQRLVSEAKAALEAAASADEEPPEHINVDDEGEPIVEMPEPLLKPSQGFVLVNFPESEEQLQAVQDKLRLSFESILVLKKEVDEEDLVEESASADGSAAEGSAEVPAPTSTDGQEAAAAPEGPVLLKGKALEEYNAKLETLANIEGMRIEEVPYDNEEHDQLVAIRKLIDPFYPIVDDPEMAVPIPDPDEWEPPEEPADGEEEGEEVDPPERPVIPWGVCGPYCPVTLKNDFWLYPGSKEFQCVYYNRVYALASESVCEVFKTEPIKFIPEREPTLPPPKILVTGPVGAGVREQCQRLAAVYGIPTLDLEAAWRAEATKRVDAVNQERRRLKLEELRQQREEEERERRALEGEPEPAADKPPGEEEEKEAGTEEVPAEEAGEGAPVEEEEEQEEVEVEPLEDEELEALYLEAMREVLGPHMGACIIDGSFFSDLDDEEMSDELKAIRTLGNLLVKARRLPDLVIMLKIKHDIAAQRIYNFDEIDIEYDQRLKAFQALCEEAENNDEEPPDPPENLILDEDEKESDRVRTRFVEKKQAQQEELKSFAEVLVTARAPLQKVVADRGPDVTHTSVRWHCRPFMEQRSSMLVRHQAVKMAPKKVADALARGLVVPSRFGNHNPLFADTPPFAGRPDAFRHAVALRSRLYYPRGEAEQEQLLARPQDFIHAASPSRVPVHPCVAVCGPPLAGKTSLARQLATRTGAVYVSVPEVLTALIDPLALPCPLSKALSACMRSGQKVLPSQAAQALQFRLAAPDVLQRGWVLDDFPCTEEQAKALTAVGIVPHRCLMLSAPDDVLIARVRLLASQNPDINGKDLLEQEQKEVELQRQRLEAHSRSGPALQAYYSSTFGNVCEIDGTKSAWAAYDCALEETSRAVSQRLEYYRRSAHGRAARVHGMCFHPKRIDSSESPWRHYCPVALTLGNELVPSWDLRCTVEHKTKIYWLASEAATKLFLDDPEAFLAVALPQTLPRRVPPEEASPAPACELEGYCPVALVDRKELILAPGTHLVQYGERFWSIDRDESCEKFLRRPRRYIERAWLPAKRPVLKSDEENEADALLQTLRASAHKGLDPGMMLTYMQVSVAEGICQSLVASGERRPLYPGKSTRESALLFLARFLRARNPLNSDLTAVEVKQKLEEYLNDCGMPLALKELTKQKEESENFGQHDPSWTMTDARRYKELCARFDTIFGLVPTAK